MPARLPKSCSPATAPSCWPANRGRAIDRRPTIALNGANFGAYPMANGISRLASRFLRRARPRCRPRAAKSASCSTPTPAEKLGLVTFALDDIDWDDEVRIFLEERASFSPDGLTGMEANLRFAGPETMESKIFGAPDRLAELDLPAARTRSATKARCKPLRHRQKAVFDPKRV